jgi:uncharacterized membrane protein
MSLGDVLKGKPLGHPLHPALAHLPAGLFPAALVSDLLYHSTASPAFVELSFAALLTGAVVALLAIPTGIADLSEIKPGKPARKLAIAHGIMNSFVLVLVIANLVIRRSPANPPTAATTALSAVATLLLLPAAYLGHRMVFHHGVAIARFSKDEWRERAEKSGANLPEKE